MAAEMGPKKPRVDLPVVLGTSSKWRRALFAQHFPECGSDFAVADIDEKSIRADRPEDMVIAIAQGKADAILPKLSGKDVLLVTMDQVVVCEGVVREKPENELQAREFLRSYQKGQGASCVNGMVVYNTKTGKRVTGVDKAAIFWRSFPDTVVDHLVSKGDVFTSAGGFICEDEQLRPFQERIEGTVESIEGLPVRPLREMLLRAAASAVTHVLFDMDGLLLDTETAYTVAQQQIVSRFGRTFTWELKAKMMGLKAVDAAQVLIDDLKLGGEISAEAFVTERETILDELFAQAALLPGVERLVRHLHGKRVPMAVATSSHRRHFDLKTGLHKELFGLMHHVVTGDQVQRSKPDPEIFLKAAELFEAAPVCETVLVFEDAPSGVNAALAAGMQVCHVPDPNLGVESRGRSFCELRTLEDFRPEEWGLPPFE